MFIFLRILQVIFTLVGLVFAVYVINKSQDAEGLRQDTDNIAKLLPKDDQAEVTKINNFIEKLLEVPDRVWVVLIVSIWTFLAIAYKPAATKWFPKGSSNSYLIPIEILTSILWLLSFGAIVSLAVEIEPLCLIADEVPFLLKYLGVCPISKVASVASAFDWALWTITSIVLCCVGKRTSSERSRSIETGPPVPPRDLGKSEMVVTETTYYPSPTSASYEGSPINEMPYIQQQTPSRKPLN
jgi:hypothetical protein